MKVGEGGITGDPSRPMGERGLRWLGRGRREQRALLPVGTGVGRIYERTSQRSPLVPLPTYDKGEGGGGRGWGQCLRGLGRGVAAVQVKRATGDRGTR